MTQKKVLIVTPYKSFEACREGCVDKKGTSKWYSQATTDLFGVFGQGHAVTITTNNKAAGSFEFKGHMTICGDAICLEGMIQAKKTSKRIVLISLLTSSLLGLFLLTTANPVWVLFGLLFMAVPWLNVWHLKKSKFLLDLIEKRFKNTP